MENINFKIHQYKFDLKFGLFIYNSLTNLMYKTHK